MGEIGKAIGESYENTEPLDPTKKKKNLQSTRKTLVKNPRKSYNLLSINSNMRIAQIASLIESVPPKKYGGIERFVHYLTEELIQRVHDFTLFATADSKPKDKL